MTSLKNSARKTHPVFSSTEGKVVLRSAEGTFYRILSNVLRNTTGLFRAVLPPSQSIGHCAEKEVVDPIPLEEKHVVVERLLRMISGLEIPLWESFDELEAVLSLSEKWEAPGPISVIRSAITAPKFLAEPLRLYAVATRFEWEEEAKLASTYTLTLSLYEEQHAEQLQRLSAKDLMKLLSFHRRRRDEFKVLIDSKETFIPGNSAEFFCVNCGTTYDNHPWRDLKARMFREIDQSPAGGTFQSGLDMEEWPESAACWKAKCGGACGKIYYSKLQTIKGIQGCLNRLPTTI